jgi:hypothetical protein
MSGIAGMFRTDGFPILNEDLCCMVGLRNANPTARRCNVLKA